MNNSDFLKRQSGRLVLEDGTVYPGFFFGHPASVAGEVVFNTGMVGYPESLSDPSYHGQILVCTYPLIGNYGVPAPDGRDGQLESRFESGQVQIRGLIVMDYSPEYSHWNAAKSLSQWLYEHQIPALSGIDTRALTKKLRSKGTMLGKIELENEETPFYNPDLENLVAKVSIGIRQRRLPGGFDRLRL
jgi:carbamoyl-phosphate synthase small subunit